jgi:hypothetical protein
VYGSQANDPACMQVVEWLKLQYGTQQKIHPLREGWDEIIRQHRLPLSQGNTT